MMTVGKLTDKQLATAKTVWNVFKSHGFTYAATCGVIGNLLSESGMTVDSVEIGGGGGYGMAQWTPKSTLYSEGAKLGMTDAECETAKGQAEILAQCDVTGSWSVPAGINYVPGCTSSLTIASFKKFTDTEQATIDWEVHLERGYIPTLHMDERKTNANWAFKQLKYYAGPDGSSGSSESKKTSLTFMGIHIYR
jgi:hypothetical protein